MKLCLIRKKQAAIIDITNITMLKKAISILPAIVFILTVFEGGGKLLYQFSFIALLLMFLCLVLLLNRKKEYFENIVYCDDILLPLILMATWAFVTMFTSSCFYSTFKNILQIAVYIIFLSLALTFNSPKPIIKSFLFLNIFQSFCLVTQLSI